jgi:hypothetical protein
VHIDRASGFLRWTGVVEDLADDRINPAKLAANDFGQIRVLMLLEEQINECFACDQGIFDLMRRASGQKTQAGEPIEPDKALLDFLMTRCCLHHKRNPRG